MKFLIDNNISRRISSHLEAAGHEAVHVGTLSMADADDGDILEHARGIGAVVVSSDTDFGVLLAFQRATSPSVILTREVSTSRPAELADLIVSNMPSFSDALEKVRSSRSDSVRSAFANFRYADLMPTQRNQMS